MQSGALAVGSSKCKWGESMPLTGGIFAGRPERDRHDRLALGVAIVGAIIAACALVQTSYQICTIRDNAKRQLRAYIGLVAPADNQVANAFFPPAKPLVRLTPKNFGLTPAYEATHATGMAIVKYPLLKRIRLSCSKGRNSAQPHYDLSRRARSRGDFS